MPQTLKKNTTSQSTLETIKTKLQGRCTVCGYKLPDHEVDWITCQYNKTDKQLRHVEEIIDEIFKEYNI